MTPDNAPTGRAQSVIIRGLNALVISIEVGQDPGAATTSRVTDHRPEARERVRAALRNSDLAWPATALAISGATPTDLTSQCDLALACAIYQATAVVDRRSSAAAAMRELLDNTVLIGELGLDGSVRPVRHIMPALLAAKRDGLGWAIVPRTSLSDIAPIPGLQVYGADRLADVAAWLRGEAHGLVELTASTATPVPPAPDIANLAGQPDGVRALEVAAAGGHHLLITSRPGTDATLLARCLPGLLPDLSDAKATDVAVIHSLCPSGRPASIPPTQPPLVTPDHRVAIPALVGWLNADIRTGVVSLADGGVLFLHDASKFLMTQLNAIRDALNTGEVTLTANGRSAHVPAQFQLVMATSACPCRQPRATCKCSDAAQQTFVSLFSDPLSDHLDIRVRLRPDSTATPAAERVRVTNAVVRQRVLRARDRATARWTFTNATVPDDVLRQVEVAPEVTEALDRAVRSGGPTPLATQRVLRVAWTLADLDDCDGPHAGHVEDAVTLRGLGPDQN